MRDGSVEVPEAAGDEESGATPHHLIITADSMQATALLIAPAEGAMRFIAVSPATTNEPQRGIPHAVAQLASQCGHALDTEMISAAVVSGPPVSVQVIGEPSADESTALVFAEHSGVIKSMHGPLIPPRNLARRRSWFQPAIDAWLSGQTQALLIILPPGARPQWAVHLFSALATTEPPPDSQCIVTASDANVKNALPPNSILIPRGSHYSPRFIAALNRLRAARVLPNLSASTPLFSRVEALSAAVRALSAGRKTPCIYLDVADGTTAIVADDDRTILSHDPDTDFSRGAMHLTQRHDPAEIVRWLPFARDGATLREWAIRRAAQPIAALTDDEDRAIAAALARTCLIEAFARLHSHVPGNALWILGPAISRLGPPAAALVMVADLMAPRQVAVVACDRDDVMPAIGALTLMYPTDTSTHLFQDAADPVGSIIQASFNRDRGQHDMSVTLTDTEGEIRTITVAPNALIPVPGQGPGTVQITGRSATSDRIAVTGGAAGILLDTRRRPIAGITRDSSRPSVSTRLQRAAVESATAHAPHSGTPHVP